MEDLIDGGPGGTFQIGVHCEALLDKNMNVPKPRAADFVNKRHFRYTLPTKALDPIARFSTRGTSIGFPTHN